MSRIGASVAVSLLFACLLAGCSDSPPPKPDYGDPALVVEGTEVWEPVSWGWQGGFDRDDTNHDGALDPGEFTARARREAHSQRALEVFRILDTDGNERLTWEEYRCKPGEATVVSLDVNGNGTISMDEFAAYKKHVAEANRLQPYFVTWDRDGDGELTTAELEAPPFENGYFDQDRDGDGMISLDEQAGPPERRRESARLDFLYRDRDCNGILTMREYLYRYHNGKFWAMDSDGDMAVSRKEFTSSRYGKRFKDPEGVFEQLDRNGDGQLGVGEFQERTIDASSVLGLAKDPAQGTDADMFATADGNGDGLLDASEILPAVSSGSKWEDLFRKADGDQDKKLSLDEYRKNASALSFLVVDTDHDGSLSQKELHEQTMPWLTPKRAEQVFAAADLNGDGKLDPQEYGDRWKQITFLTYDADEDDHLSREEFGHHKGHLLQRGRFMQVFAIYDLDGNGTLSRAEHGLSPLIAEFVERDTNDDHRLSLAEYVGETTNVSSRNSRTRFHEERDRDGDGLLSYREFLNEHEFRLFWAMDKSEDDAVSVFEFQAANRSGATPEVLEPLFRKLDLNGNGKLELSEYAGRSDGARMAELDRDGDSFLSLKEFSEIDYRQKRLAQKAFTQADANSDGKLTLEEYKNRESEESLQRGPSDIEIMFGDLDVDKDSSVTREEFMTEPRKTQIGPALAEVFERSDRNKDGNLTLEECSRSREPLHFLILDEDGDGVLSADEYYAYVPWASPERNAALVAALDKDGSGDLQYPEFKQQWGVARLLLEDRDEDGGVQFEEFQMVRSYRMAHDAIQREFDAYDRDGNHVLTAEETADPPYELSFLEKDDNSDGVITAEEFLARAPSEEARLNRQREFRRLDRNGDGKVTLREHYFQKTNAKFWAMDRDGDMAVSAEEFAASKHASTLSKPEAAFKALDLNGDGALSIAEYEKRSNDVPTMFGTRPKTWARDATEMFSRLDLDGDGAVVRPEIAKEAVEAMERFGKELEEMDQNKDGKVTLDEFRNRSVPFDFPAWDADRNGSLSLEELRNVDFSWATDSHAAAIFSAIDSDGNGAVSFPEYSSRNPNAPLLLADWDEDGTITIEEFASQNQNYCDRGQLQLAFQTLDRDGDGHLSRDEFTKKPLSIRFLDRDTDGDGVVGKAEFCSVAKSLDETKAREKDFVGKDQDKNGSLSQREFYTEKDCQLFWAGDQDQDNVLSAEELAKVEAYAELGEGFQRLFGEIDRNKDAVISLDEYDERCEEARSIESARLDKTRMTELDKDGDSLLTLAEFLAAGYSQPRFAVEAFESADKNSDKKLTFEEFRQRPGEKSMKEGPSDLEVLFQALDADKDKKVTREEFMTEARKAKIGPALDGIFDRCDSNRDGKLTYEECGKGREPLHFMILDESGDGALSASEYYAFVPWASPERHDALVAALDKDGSGDLQYAEFTQQWGVARLLLEDRNEDGSVVFEEFQTVRKHNRTPESVAREFAAYDRDGNEVLSPEEISESPFTLGFVLEDANGDRRITLEEYLSKAYTGKARANRQRDFLRLDRNGDGQVTLRENYFTRATAKFWAMDRDGDMNVDEGEFGAAKHAESIENPSAAFRELDTDGDGAICIGEFERRSQDMPALFGVRPKPWPHDVAAMFSKLDLDGDGAVVKSEIVKEGVEAMARFGKELEGMDQDKDGKVTLEEFRNRSVPFDFPAWDADRNGSLSPEELRTVEFSWASDSYAASLFHAIDADGDGAVSFPEFADRFVRAPQLFADWDEDGIVSIEEFAATNQKYCDCGKLTFVFSALDRNSDGGLTQEELGETPAAVCFIDQDANGDGSIDQDEFCSGTKSPEDKDGRQKEFAAKDGDKDGILTQEEFLAQSKSS